MARLLNKERRLIADTLYIRVTVQQGADWRRRARAEGESISKWGRKRILRALRAEQEETEELLSETRISAILEG